MRPYAGLLLIACLPLVGCADLTYLRLLHARSTVPVTKAKAKKKAAPKRPVGAKAYYLRMAEVDRAATILLGSERRRIRRLRTQTSFPARRRGLLASVDNIDGILTRANAELTRLGPAPETVRPFRELWRTEVREDQGIVRRLRIAIRRYDLGAVERESGSILRSVSRHRSVERTEARLRWRLGLKRKPPAAYVAPDSRPLPEFMLGRSPTRSAVVASPLGPTTAREDLRFVRYSRDLLVYLVRHNAALDRWSAESRANVPTDPDEIDAFVRRKVEEGLAYDRDALEFLRRLGTPPAEIREYRDRMRQQVQSSADALAEIAASGDDARGMLARLNQATAKEQVARDRAGNLAASVPMRTRLEQIYARGTVPKSEWFGLAR